jgi:hypothetical protein
MSLESPLCYANYPLSAQQQQTMQNLVLAVVALILSSTAYVPLVHHAYQSVSLATGKMEIAGFAILAGPRLFSAVCPGHLLCCHSLESAGHSGCLRENDVSSAGWM